MGLFDKKPPPAPPTRKQTTSRLHSVICPWCGKGNDMRGIDSTNLIDNGSEFDCDHCHHIFIVVKVEQVKLLTCVQHPTKVGLAPREIKR